MMYARYSPTVQMEVIAKYAHGTPFVPQYAGMVMISDATETARTAYSGTRAWFSRRKSHQPGMPRSREKAYHVRDALVSPAAPQNSCPTVAMIRISLAPHKWLAMALVKIVPTKPPVPSTAFVSVAAKRNASIRNQPRIAE